MKTKICSDCQLSLSAQSFTKNPKGRDGLQTYCRACSSIRLKLWHSKNRAAVIAKKAAHYKEKKEEILAKQKAYYADNKTRILLRQKKPAEVNRSHVADWAKKNPEKRKAQQRRQTAALTDAYIRRRVIEHIGLKNHQISTEILELKRASIEARRLGLQLKKAINESC